MYKAKLSVKIEWKEFFEGKEKYGQKPQPTWSLDMSLGFSKSWNFHP